MEAIDWILVFASTALLAGAVHTLSKTYFRRDPSTAKPPSAEGTNEEAASKSVSAKFSAEDFRQHILPKVLERWAQHCFCSNAGFVRMVSLDLGPTALADAQILIDELIRERFVQDGPLEYRNSESIQQYRCPQCGSRCRVHWEQFSIHMDRSYIEWLSLPEPVGAKSFYLLGFYGYSLPRRIDGFQKVDSPDEFIEELSRHG